MNLEPYGRGDEEEGTGGTKLIAAGTGRYCTNIGNRVSQLADMPPDVKLKHVWPKNLFSDIDGKNTTFLGFYKPHLLY